MISDTYDPLHKIVTVDKTVWEIELHFYSNEKIFFKYRKYCQDVNFRQKRVIVTKKQTKCDDAPFGVLKATSNYLIAYNNYDIMSVKMSGIFRNKHDKVRAKFYNSGLDFKVLTNRNYLDAVAIIDIVHVGGDVIAVGAVNTNHMVDPVSIVFFIDLDSRRIWQTEPLKDISIRKLFAQTNNRVMALCDDHKCPWAAYKGVDKIVLIDPIVLYSIDIETGMVVAKSTT
jgi:hypothetical protein